MTKIFNLNNVKVSYIAVYPILLALYSKNETPGYTEKIEYLL